MRSLDQQGFQYQVVVARWKKRLVDKLSNGGVGQIPNIRWWPIFPPKIWQRGHIERSEDKFLFECHTLSLGRTGHLFSKWFRPLCRDWQSKCTLWILSVQGEGGGPGPKITIWKKLLHLRCIVWDFSSDSCHLWSQYHLDFCQKFDHEIWKFTIGFPKSSMARAERGGVIKKLWWCSGWGEKRGKPPNFFLLIKEEREKTNEVKAGWSESKEVKYEKVVYEEKEGVDGSPNVRLWASPMIPSIGHRWVGAWWVGRPAAIRSRRDPRKI